MTPVDVEALLARAQEGDVRAFEELVRAHLGVVRRYARAHAPREADADDLAQDALLKAYRCLRQFRYQCAFSTWLYTIVRSVFLDAAKSRAGRERTHEAHARSEGEPDAAPAPDELLARAQDRARIWRALRRIPVEFRGAIVLFDVEGLARFRSGRPQQALEALDAAAHASDRPERGPWHFNRGACLYALGRFAEAEEAFVAAAADPSLAAIALADAGFAALDAGAPARASALAASARAVAAGSTLALVEELEVALGDRAPPPAEGGEGDPPAERKISGGGPAAAAYREGLAAYDGGRFAEARRAFLRAGQLAPNDGRPPLMAGAAALSLGARAAAREDVLHALTLDLGDADARIARDYLAEASYGLASRPGGLAFSAHAGAGFDDKSYTRHATVLDVAVAF